MDVREYLDKFREHRKMKPTLQRLKKDEDFLAGILEEIPKNEYPYSEYAAWIIQHFFEHTRTDFAPYKKRIVGYILESQSTSAQRSLIHIFTKLKPQVQENGELLDHLFRLLDNPDSPVAVKVICFKAIEKQYLKAYPELLQELGLRIERMKTDERPSIQALRRNFLKKHHSR